MGQPGPQMIAGAVQENLGFVLKPPKCARVNDASAVALKFGPVSMALLGIFASARVARFLRERRERGALGGFPFLTRFPTVLHLAINPSMSILSVALPRRSLLSRRSLAKAHGEGGPLPTFRAMRAPLAALATAPPANQKR